MQKLSIIIFCFLILSQVANAGHQPEFSTAGFYKLDGSGRDVHNMNPAWRFYKGAMSGAERTDFDDKDWSVVSLPHGIEYLPVEASGCINYQGETWYRKHFTPAQELKGKKLFLYFEAIMGKTKIYVNGILKKEHFGGYLPISIDISNDLKWEGDNVIAVWADNSDDPMFPPGKAQDIMDFTYFGGIYRDCWLVSHNPVFITDPNYEDEVAGGGLFVAYDNVSDKSADVILNLHTRNDSNKDFAGKVEFTLQETNGKVVLSRSKRINIIAGKSAKAYEKVSVKNPQLWSPDSPTLYNIIVTVKDNKGKTIDGYRQRIGIRSIEFKGVDGFWLNGKPYPSPLIGVNRHQDYAIVGNAVANGAHWRDAKKLRDAGLKVVRNAHYPQDPAFMDACDELGLFVIVNTPGWQFWNDTPIFEQRVYNDIRNMVRRDRNRASVWMWEPILNETWYPDSFAKKAKDAVDEEYPYPYCYCACDKESKGTEYFPIIFSHTANAEKQLALEGYDKNKTYYTREWGDNVDDWSSHNSPSRVSRGWGEEAMLVQAKHYAYPSYPCTNYETLYLVPRQHVGGALWHSFDHQRGYHPDPFYGGFMDAFRQPKTSYYMFKAQRDPAATNPFAETGPMVYIAHEMTPFSGKDVNVFSNCDEVRLTYTNDGKVYHYKKEKNRKGMPSPIITFKDVYDFMIDKNKSMYEQKQAEIFLLAEGYINGKLVATHKVVPARRPSKILLWADNEGMNLEANGSDFVTVIAAVADEHGVIKRLNDYKIKFTVEGEGRLLGDASIMANPVPVCWGTAPALIQSSTKAGKIKITASVLMEGSQMPMQGELEIETVPSSVPLIFSSNEAHLIPNGTVLPFIDSQHKTLDKAKAKERIKEVEKQQEEFGEKRQ